MRRNARDHIRNTLYFAVGLMIIYGGPSLAGPDLTAEVYDVTFWFRALLSGLLAVLIYVAKGTEDRVKASEDDIRRIDKSVTENKGLITQHKGSILFLENEVKQTTTTLATLEKILIRNYHDKDETNQHRARVELELRDIRTRLDNMSPRPFHRRHDDEEGRHDDRT